MGESSYIDYRVAYINSLKEQLMLMANELSWFKKELESAYARGFVTAQGQPSPIGEGWTSSPNEMLEPIPGLELPSERRIRLAKESREKAAKAAEEREEVNDEQEL